MGFIDKLFGGSGEQENTSKVGWIPLTDLAQLDTLVAESSEVPVLLFKHSTRCSISRFVLKQFENDYSFTDLDLKPYFLDLIRYRDVSNEIANRFHVVHQSPQVIVIKNGEVVYDASHESIAVAQVKNKL